jgi:cellulose biosynthesis protein BcsQ
MSHAYIAHAPEDLDTLLEVHEALRQAGISDWYPPADRNTITRGELERRTEDAFAMIVIVSGNAMRAREVREDIERARAAGISLIPYRIDRARLSGIFKTHVAPHLKLDAGEAGAREALVAETRRAYHRRCPVLAVMNLKGGVGKTTVASQVFGTWQAETGKRVLLIDLDPQYNLTQVFFDMDMADACAAKDRSVISLFEKSRLHASGVPSPAADWSQLSTEPFSPSPRRELVHELLGSGGPDGRLDLVSGQFEISKYAFATDAGALRAIKSNFLAMIEHLRSQYDLIVFDTNPNATFLTKCCLEAADRVLAPMHPDVYSLRGVRLLNQVIEEHIEADKRPALSVLFNAVGRREQSTFEADARNGVYNAAAGFRLSGALMSAALPRSGHLAVRVAPDPETAPWRRLVIHHSRGGGVKQMREALKAVAAEFSKLHAGHVTAGQVAV